MLNSPTLRLEALVIDRSTLRSAIRAHGCNVPPLSERQYGREDVLLQARSVVAGLMIDRGIDSVDVATIATLAMVKIEEGGTLYHARPPFDSDRYRRDPMYRVAARKDICAILGDEVGVTRAHIDAEQAERVLLTLDDQLQWSIWWFFARESNRVIVELGGVGRAVAVARLAYYAAGIVRGAFDDPWRQRARALWEIPTESPQLPAEDDLRPEQLVVASFGSGLGAKGHVNESSYDPISHRRGSDYRVKRRGDGWGPREWDPTWLIIDDDDGTPEGPVRARQHGTGRKRVDKGAVRVTRPDGSVSFTELGHDGKAIREFLEREAATEGADLDDLLSEGRRGRLTEENQRKREVLEILVARALLAGARGESLGEVIGRSPSAVSRLGKAGKRALSTPGAKRKI